jgi:hypothetical protein
MPQTLSAAASRECRDGFPRRWGAVKRFPQHVSLDAILIDSTKILVEPYKWPRQL